MNCNDYEDLILDAQDARLPEAQQRLLEIHLAACPACRTFQQAQARVDAALTTVFVPPRLSAGFRERVIAGVEAQRLRLKAESRAELRQAIQREHDARLAEMKKSLLGPWGIRVLDVVGLGVAGLLVAVLLPALASAFPNASVRLSSGWQLDWRTHGPWLAVAVCWAAGTALAFRRDLLSRFRV